MRPALFVTFVGTLAAAAVVGSAQASLVVDDFTAGSINRSSSNTSGQSSVQTETHPSFFPGSTNVRRAWVGGTLGETSSSPSNAQSIFSSGNGSAAFSVHAARDLAGNGTTTSSAHLLYGGSGTNLDLSGYTSFDAAGHGDTVFGPSFIVVQFLFLLYITDQNEISAAWSFIKEYNSLDGSASTVPVGNISFNLSLTQGRPDSPVVGAGFNMAAIKSLEFRVSSSVMGGSESNPSYATLNYTVDSLTLVPTPGAVALLGVAGLMGRRRRH